MSEDYESAVNQRLIVAGVPKVARKTLAFTGAAALGQSASPIPLFTRTGSVIVEKIVAICSEDLASAGGGTLALGVTGSTSLFIGATTATNIDVGEIWASTTPTAAGIALPAALKDIAINADIIATVATADITDGTLDFVVYYRPLSSDGALVAA